MMKMPTIRELRTTPIVPLRLPLRTALGLLLLWALLSPRHLAAQAAPAVLGGDHTLWAGVEYSNFTPDFGPPQRLIGVGGYVDFNWNSRYAIEGETRFLRFNGFNGEYEDNYLAGPKINVFATENSAPMQSLRGKKNHSRTNRKRQLFASPPWSLLALTSRINLRRI